MEPGAMTASASVLRLGVAGALVALGYAGRRLGGARDPRVDHLFVAAAAGVVFPRGAWDSLLPVLVGLWLVVLYGLRGLAAGIVVAAVGTALVRATGIDIFSTLLLLAVTAALWPLATALRDAARLRRTVPLARWRPGLTARVTGRLRASTPTTLPGTDLPCAAWSARAGRVRAGGAADLLIDTDAGPVRLGPGDITIEVTGGAWPAPGELGTWQTCRRHLSAALPGDADPAVCWVRPDQRVTVLAPSVTRVSPAPGGGPYRGGGPEAPHLRGNPRVPLRILVGRPRLIARGAIRAALHPTLAGASAGVVAAYRLLGAGS